MYFERSLFFVLRGRAERDYDREIGEKNEILLGIS
jgi:hypothetical protein